MRSNMVHTHGIHLEGIIWYGVGAAKLLEMGSSSQMKLELNYQKKQKAGLLARHSDAKYLKL